jgi:predicted DNA-binding WGR domain protein
MEIAHMSDAADIELRLIDPAKNRYRLYGLTECRTLFGELCLHVVWGRIGHRKLRERSETFEGAGELEARRAELLARRRQHGYRVVEPRAPRRLTERHDTALGTVLAPTTERPAVRVDVAGSIERDVVEAHGLRLGDTTARALVERWHAAARELAAYVRERAPEVLDLEDVSTLAAMYARAAGLA